MTDTPKAINDIRNASDTIIDTLGPTVYGFTITRDPKNNNLPWLIEDSPFPEDVVVKVPKVGIMKNDVTIEEESYTPDSRRKKLAWATAVLSVLLVVALGLLIWLAIVHFRSDKSNTSSGSYSQSYYPLINK